MSLNVLYDLQDNPETTETADMFYSGASILLPLAFELKQTGDNLLSNENATIFTNYLENSFENKYGSDINFENMFLGLTGNSASDLIFGFVEDARDKYNIQDLNYNEIEEMYNTIGGMPTISDPLERSAELMQFIETKKERLVGQDGILMNADIMVDDIFTNFEEQGWFESFIGHKGYVNDLNKDILKGELDTLQVPNAPMMTSGFSRGGSNFATIPEISFKDKRVRENTSISPDDLYEPRIDLLTKKNLKLENIGDTDQYIPTEAQLAKLVNVINNNMSDLDNDEFVFVEKNLPRYIETMGKAKQELESIKNIKGILDMQVKVAREKNG